MNKYTLIFLFTFVATIAKGQEYSPLLTDGRTWHYRVDVTIGEEMATTFTDAFFYGDTIVAGIPCKKLYCASGYDNDMSTSSRWFPEIGLEGKYHSAWYEDGKKVYLIMKETTTPELVFDFGLQVGDNLPNNESLVYKYDDYITVNGNIEGEETSSHTYRRLRFTESGTGNDELSDWCLVEGIGGNEGVLYTEFQTTPINGCIYEHFMYCSQFLENKDGYPVYEMLFGKDNFLVEASNQAPLSLLQDNKEWMMSYQPFVAPEFEGTANYEQIALGASADVDGHIFRQIEVARWENGNEVPTSKEKTDTYLGEQDGKVYMYNEASQQKLLVMDFSLNVGDTYRQYNWDNGDSYEDFVVRDISTVVIEKSTDKTPRKCLSISHSGSEEITEVWIEGVGSLTGGIYGAYEQLMDGAVPRLLQCTVVEDIIYLDTTATGIQTSHTARHTTHNTQIYNLHGQRMSSVPQNGIYIRGGKKQVVYY